MAPATANSGYSAFTLLKSYRTGLFFMYSSVSSTVVLLVCITRPSSNLKDLELYAMDLLSRYFDQHFNIDNIAFLTVNSEIVDDKGII